jgi:hypothetical protein
VRRGHFSPASPSANGTDHFDSDESACDAESLNHNAESSKFDAVAATDGYASVEWVSTWL